MRPAPSASWAHSTWRAIESVVIDRIVPKKNDADRVERIAGPGCYWYSNAMGGPPMPAAVPVTPETDPGRELGARS